MNRGRPALKSPYFDAIKQLNIGESVLIPRPSDERVYLQAVKTRYFRPAKKLGYRLAFQMEGNKIRIERLE